MSSSEWKKIKLVDLTKKIGSGATPRGGSKVYLDSGIPLIRSQNVYNCKFSKGGIVYINQESAKKLDNVTLHQNDIILNITGDSVARCTIVPDEYIGSRVNQHVAIIRTDNDLLSPQFLKYFLVSPNMQAEMLSLARMGATRAALNKGMIESFEIPIPKLNEQKAIANILFALDEKIEVNNKINETLKKMAQTLFKEWFVDFEFPNENGDPYRSSGGEMAKSEIGMIPKHWKYHELREFFKFIKGKKPKRIEENPFEKSVKYLTISVLNRNSLLYASNEKVINAEKEDVLMVMDGASSGDIYSGLNGAVGSTLAKLEIKNDTINSYFLINVMKYYVDEIKKHQTGSAIPHTDKEFTYRLKLALPVTETSVYIKARKMFQLSYEQVVTLQEENEKLKVLRDTLLPKLMSGEIRIPIDENEESLVN